MSIENKMKKYNELTDAWNKGCLWAEVDRSSVQMEKGLLRLIEILDELAPLYDEIKSYGIKVNALEKLQLKEEKK